MKTYDRPDENEDGLVFTDPQAEARYRAIVREVHLEAESLTADQRAAAHRRAELIHAAVRRARLLLEWAGAPVPDLVRSALAEAAANDLFEACYQAAGDDEPAAA